MYLESFFDLVLSSGCMGLHCMLKTYILSYVQTYCEAVTFSRSSDDDVIRSAFLGSW